MTFENQKRKQSSFSLLATQFYLIFLCLLNRVNAIGLSNDTAAGCLPSINVLATKYPGFNIEFYHYNFLSYNDTIDEGMPDFNTYQSDAYVAGGYADQGSFGSTSGVTNLTYSYFPSGDLYAIHYGNLPSNYDYDETFTLTNFTYVATGYFVPPSSGTYTFYLKYIDDLGVLSIGANSAFKCCLADSSGTDGTYQIRSIWTSEGPSGTNQIAIDMTEGVYYPIRVLHTNRQALGAVVMRQVEPLLLTHHGLAHIPPLLVLPYIPLPEVTI
ncbi:uncharacterized protein SCODWIG_02261 [Saccharomycodes ludwigii]|uniref:PA14 domain-containing protein n=1 Tax=Saccharomycodes ludwigii TaxID=36035 RepID=A0A376B8Q2_9ASCO|nr:uncharacterized protein SCODWIG_02261 [Saccharomycodes ludwigii]